MNEVYIDIKNDEELGEVFKNKDLVSVDDLRNKIIVLFNEINREEDNYDAYMNQCLEEGRL